ncbi:hypothetical protein L1887_28884 [Cichorium endivia]|nr:hypothetical protein L1887_28884 [Cichorium endivia]
MERPQESVVGRGTNGCAEELIADGYNQWVGGGKKLPGRWPTGRWTRSTALQWGLGANCALFPTISNADRHTVDSRTH